MRKTLLLLLFILVPALLAQAQYARLGAKVGGNLSRVQGSDGSSSLTNNLAGFNGGLILSYEFVSRLALQAELQYEQKGFVYDNYPISTNEVLTDDHRLHYLTLPLMLKLQKGGLFVEGGPYVGYLVGESTQVKRVDSQSAGSDNPVILGNYSLHLTDFERWDYGYTVGIGLELDNGFFVSLHNMGGLTSFSKALDQKNFGFKLSIGYLLRPPSVDEMML
ncbi:porin family protein [Pontibacter chinhatensis]|uniref:Outer membrane protein beta-barrel domain-containing protein n=1 Tax=Pontibacter chinhatensis TaxID=1436961 RepID=A0A1I2Z7S4_9BACT|nr:porin family protein [Pontibacter chinhatensis]SFH33968.1 Outer membrane protein beta-barrel domain-containing protein [Pontibacter chinhatensis]